MNPLLIRRRGMMAGKTLPYDAEIEYLEGGNKPYIDTGINTSNLLEFEGEMVIINPTSNINFGGRWGTQNKSNALLYDIGTNNFQYRYSNRQTVVTSLPPGTSCYFHTNEGGMTINNVTVPPNPIVFDAETTFCLFACKNHNGTFAGDLSVGLRMKWIKLFYDRVLARDFIPVRVGTVGYMYDRVSGQLFGNAGTGDFILGPDIQ